MRLLRRIYQGARWSPDYGSHPGTPIVLLLILSGTLACGWRGTVATTVVFGALWCIGAYERGAAAQEEKP